jgi:hypothetical protein
VFDRKLEFVGGGRKPIVRRLVSPAVRGDRAGGDKSLERQLGVLNVGGGGEGVVVDARGVPSDLLISGLRVEGSDRRNSGPLQLVVQKMWFAAVDR